MSINGIHSSDNDQSPTGAYHVAALKPECIAGLAIRKDGLYADATFGGGGHSRAILDELGPDGHLYGFDRDADASANIPDDSRFTFVHGDFRYMANFLDYVRAGRMDGIIADLGVSFHHFDTPERGFSFRSDAPLDMRMNRSGGITAADIVATYTPAQLTGLLRSYTDLNRPGMIADAIVRVRSTKPIITTEQLAAAVQGVLPPNKYKKDLAQVFQALRIETNSEMEALKLFLESVPGILRPGGRLVILTYHSIEDRIVKNFLRAGNVQGEVSSDFYGYSTSPWKILTRKPIMADQSEVERNPRARSAKLRIATLLAERTKQ